MEFTAQRLSQAAIRPVILAPALRKLTVLRVWLLGATLAQVTLAFSLLMLLLVLPPIFGKALEVVYPPQQGKVAKFLGLKNETFTKADPRVETGKKILLGLSWIGAGGVLALLMFIRIPAAVARASETAKRKESEGDSLLESQPLRSLSLYRSAISFATDREHERVLRSKLDDLDRRISTGIASVPPATRLDGSTAPVPMPAGATIMPDGGSSRRVGAGGRYELASELGRGGMGVVYLARDRVLERDVAFKELPSRLAGEGSFAARFRQEARLLARLSHPNIVQIFDLVEEGDRLWMAMELMQGGDLETMLQRSGKLSLETAAAIGAPLAAALGFAHSKGIVHRDFKPMNVLLSAEKTPKVTDFGLAKVAEETMNTQEGSVLGSPRYMSPEQAAGTKADARADIYSLGITLYQMLTGKPPFEGDTASLLAQHITRAPESPRALVPGLPEKIDALVLRMLAKDPEKRIQDMGDVVKALSPYAGAGGGR